MSRVTATTRTTRGTATAATATTATPVGMSAEQQAAIDAAGEATARMGRVDRVHFWDKRQAGPDAIVCGHDHTHGRLIMHGNGSLLLCTATKHGAPCTFNQPVSV